MLHSKKLPEKLGANRFILVSFRQISNNNSDHRQPPLLMLRLDDIKKPIDQELTLFEEKFRTSMKSSVPLLDRITHYIVKRKGKQMRSEERRVGKECRSRMARYHEEK